jgi:hypothetical protein
MRRFERINETITKYYMDDDISTRIGKDKETEYGGEIFGVA